MQERRKHSRLPVLQNIGDPITLDFVHNSKRISIPGFIMNLSAGGMGIMTLGTPEHEIHVGTTFMLNLSIAGVESKNVEGRIAYVDKSPKAKKHHSSGEWMIGLAFTHLKSQDAHKINRMGEDWNVCDTKIQMNLPDICFEECTCWKLCDKSVKLTEIKTAKRHAK